MFEHIQLNTEAATGVFYERRFLTDFAKFTRKQLYHVFPSEFSETSQNTFFTEQLRVTTSAHMHQISLSFLFITWNMSLPAGYLVKKTLPKSHPEISSKAVVHRCFLKKLLHNISQNSQEITCVGVCSPAA